MTNPLSAERILALSGSLPDQMTIEVVTETGSTNADLLALIQKTQETPEPQTSPTRSPMLLIAEQQTAGRGRAGRSWLSAPSTALMFSLAWRFDLPLQKLVGLPLAVGVAVATGLNSFLRQTNVAGDTTETGEIDFGIRLKWPNDLLLGDGKLGGILIETANAESNAIGSGSAWAVIGVGINLAIPAEMQKQLNRSVANLPGSGPGTERAICDRNLLMATILSSLTRVLNQFQQNGLVTFVGPWNRLHAHAGRPVVIMDQGTVLQEGLALGIDEIGRFLLQTAQADHPIAIMAGDVSLRAKET
ncbi:biotin--[acetyl-CoA-carboxylase] ligase [Glaciimonas sp. PAMC28666]|uniref:biotin--[acetyl-CoA-carboxylase] ligase n=1 Tax=Glaciimonas sp. PAMC28666 TaxID=2807626 RepID=UPI001965C1A3|nr:biotin--[acetyl-CoA-carboxylase] ligase [Glaciimonas sp. PAMC28666]QRX84103.1 biotin--[acetyl-CoA-carboxylase] ligase [Glaciimonas sp. PAMC28666]